MICDRILCEILSKPWAVSRFNATRGGFDWREKEKQSDDCTTPLRMKFRRRLAMRRRPRGQVW